jgi:hypothetical protein
VRRGRAALLLVAGLATVSACRRRAPSCPGGALVELDSADAPIGFGASFTIVAKPLCAAGRAGTLTWRPVAGAGARAVETSEAGFVLRASTPTLAEALGGPAPWGVIPLSPRTRGEVVFEALWRDGSGFEERHEARVAAAPRARGLASTPVGARVYLGPLGATWRLDARPPRSAAALAATSGAPSLVPDVAGDYRLVDGAGRALTLRAARYDETPLDCARAGCHLALARASAASPMTSVLARGLAPAPGSHGALASFGAAYPGCALACHATGEPGVADGGFSHVLHELGPATFPASARGARPWDEVPRALRRLGGVGCLACHGPGALPETSARWAILRTDVCATCHDAPPRYGHVVAWRGSAMSRADRDPRARVGGCARCHTTWGALASAGGELPVVDRRPPPDSLPGITCAACHAPHERNARPAGWPALLRAVPRPALLAEAALAPSATKSAVCLGCHTPAAGEPVTASAAPLWLGRGGLEPTTGAPLVGPAPHAAIEGGCVGCHRGGPAELERGAAHAFVARREDCRACHAGGVPADDLRARARAAWEVVRARLGATPDEGAPPHAGGRRLDLSTPLGRAGWDVSLVLEDPAAAAHNAPYARLLLSAAEKTFNRPGAPMNPGAHP